MSKVSIVELPQKDRFDLPEVLKHLKSLGHKREDLFDFLRLGQLHAVCHPYRLEPDRQIRIEPDEWPQWWRDAWAFPVYDGYIGDIDTAEHGTRVPLHIFPRAARPDCDRVLMDGGKAVASAPVYVLRPELSRFLNWLKNPSKSRPGRRRKGAGRPTFHDYSDIDTCLESRFKAMGLTGFERQSDAIANLKDQLGDLRTIPDSTLRNHIDSWLKKRTNPND